MFDMVDKGPSPLDVGKDMSSIALSAVPHSSSRVSVWCLLNVSTFSKGRTFMQGPKLSLKRGCGLPAGYVQQGEGLVSDDV